MHCRFSSSALLLAASLVIGGCADHSHYSGMHTREIKALSSADIDGIRAARGMSLALPAELNGYPGPLHVLELAEKLGLSDSQRAATEQLQQRMKEAAIAAGEEYIAAERELDRLFSSKSVTPDKLRSALAAAGNAKVQLREVHLQTHLEQVQILTPQQVAQYNQLRGYGG